LATGSLSDWYEAYAGRMRALGEARFRLSRDTAEALVHDVFVSFHSLQATVRNPGAWLLGGMHKACCRYIERDKSVFSAPGCEKALVAAKARPFARSFAHDPREQLEQNLLLDQVSQQLSEQCRDVIHLRFFEGMTAREMAAELDTTIRYAEKLIHKCVERARAIYTKLRPGRRER